MPGRKLRTNRRKKRKAPTRTTEESTLATSTPSVVPPSVDPSSSLTSSSSTATPSTSCTSSQVRTASDKKLSRSVSDILDRESSGSESDELCEGRGVRMLELEGLQSALGSVVCKECSNGPIVLKEDFVRREGLCTKPFLFCESCSNPTSIEFSTAGESKALSINRKAVFASKCAGGSRSSLQMFCAMLDAPSPVSKNIYTQYNKEMCEISHLQAQESMKQARKEIRENYGATSSEDIIDVIVSCDGTWQKRGFSSLYGAVFLIAYETGKVIDYTVIDYTVMSKYCAGCKFWEKQDKLSEEYKEWKSSHVCDAITSAVVLEPWSLGEQLTCSRGHLISACGIPA